ncbi:MAG: sensor histidine kinase [Candidatus Xenobiia bacterium LiM19]
MSKKIMIVEDDREIAEIIKLTLESSGYEVVDIADEGKGIIDRIDDKKPDLIIMDIMLHDEEMDGIQIAELISRSSGTPIVYITGHSAEAIFQRARITRPYGYILKPFRPLELRATVEMALLKSKAESELKNHSEELEELVKLRTRELSEKNEHLQREITERKQAELSLIDSQNYLNKIINSIADPVFVKDRSRRWTLLNDSFCRLIGYTREELLGKSDSDFLPASEAESSRQKDELVFETGESINEEEFTDKKGTTCTVSTKRTLYSDTSGNLHIVGIMRDVTEQKHYESQIKASLKEKEILLREVHHRVKNNLQLMASLLHIQADHTKDPGIQKYYEESKNRIKSMALVHEYLYCSDTLSQINLGNHIRTIATYLGRNYRRYDLNFSFELDTVYLPIDIAVPCGLIVNELVSNAIKHGLHDIADGTLHITLKGSENNQVILTIGDNGCGFPEHLDFKESPSMGLQLVNDLVEQIDGTVELDSSSGTTFIMKFSRSGSDVTAN